MIANEAARLKALRAYHILDTDPEGICPTIGPRPFGGLGGPFTLSERLRAFKKSQDAANSRQVRNKRRCFFNDFIHATKRETG